jgi:hypothetical protein
LPHRPPKTANNAFSFEGVDLEDLLALRLDVHDALAGSPESSPQRHVLLWLWRWESTGRPLTRFGAETGRELRFSRYKTGRY